MAYRDDQLRGVKGWLAVFILTLVAFGPVQTLIGLTRNLYGDPNVAIFFGGRWPLVQAVEWGLTLAAAGISVHLGWRLNKRREWRSVEFAVAGIWLIWPAMLFGEAVVLWLIAGLPLGDMFDGAGRGSVRWLGYGRIRTLYLLRSVRVANTYPRPVAHEELGFLE